LSASKESALKNALKRHYPLLEGGGAAPYKQRARYLSRRAAGEVRKVFLQQVFDLPGRAEVKAAFHLFDRRGHPSFEEGK
jgi:hypothetical protein